MRWILYAFPASGFFQTSMNSTVTNPSYSLVNSFKTGTIILQGMHLSAPRSSRRGRAALVGAFVAGSLENSSAIAVMDRTEGQQAPDREQRLPCVRASSAARNAAAPTNRAFLDTFFI